MDPLSAEAKRLVALNLPLAELLRLCETSFDYSVICEDDTFWRSRTELEFPNSIPHRPQKILWRDYYTSMANPRFIPVYQNGDWIMTELPFSNYNPSFSLPWIGRIFSQTQQRETAVFYDRNFNPILVLNEGDD